MQELFRYVFVRPARRPTRGAIALNAGLTSLGQRLLAIGRGEDARDRIVTAAAQFLESADFARNTSTLSLYEAFTSLQRALEREPQVTLSSLARMIRQSFAEPAAELIQDARFASLRVRVTEAIVALKIQPARWPRLLSDYVLLLRLIDLVERVAQGDRLLDGQSARALLRRNVALPEELFPLPGGAAKLTLPNEEAARERARKASAIDARLADVAAALTELDSIPTGDLAIPERAMSTCAAPNAEINALRARIQTMEAALREVGATHVTAAASVAGDASPALAAPSGSRRVLDGGSDIALRSVAPAISAAANGNRTSHRAHARVARLSGADPSVTPVEHMLARLQTEHLHLAAERETLQISTTPAPFVRIGNTTLPAPLPQLDVDDFASPEGPKVPTTVGLVRPAGVGSLLVVKQQIKRYEAGEISDCANVLMSEKREHETRRLERTEETLTTETETTRQQERDLQSTERMELSKATQNTIQEDERFKIGATISGGFGTVVQAEVSTEYETSSSQEDTEQTQTTFARDVTQRTVSKMSERIRSEHTIRTIEEFEEKNAHGFDNTLGTEHVIGIYQWLDRIYEAQVHDYGIRLFFDVMVPEPAAFQLQAIASRVGAAEGLERPKPFTRKPSELTPQNYHDYVRTYQAADVEPPPPLYRTVSLPLEGATQNATDPELTRTQEVQLPDGYEAVSAMVTASFVAWEKVGDDVVFDHAALWFHVGQNVWKKGYGDGHTRFMWLDNEQQTLPVAMRTLFVSSFAAAIEISCRRTSAYEKWQLKTHAAILAGYLKLKQDYDDKLAALSVESSTQPEGRNPTENRAIERTELKRQAISTITGQYFEAFGAIRQSATQEARIDFDEALAEGNYARFFEQAFDWDNMTYEFYPYYWARRTTWVDRLLTQDVDSLHAEFLKAGYARLRIPVNPDFERGVFHFLDTGSVWQGGELPEITSTGYVALLEEIAQRRETATQEIPVGPPWDIRLPTTLVRVKPTPALPAWERNDEGEWLPVPE
jgi:hypothetical protein